MSMDFPAKLWNVDRIFVSIPIIKLIVTRHAER